MNRPILALAGVLSLAAVASAQCALGDHPNCVNWKRNGFCVNGAYTKIQKQQYCPSCPEAGCSGAAATTAKPKENANCKTWNADKTKVFCGNDKITFDQKKTFCFDTCKAEIDNKDQCAVYILTGDKVERKPEASAPPATATGTATAAGAKVLYAFAKSKCKLNLYDVTPVTLNPTPGPVTPPTGTCDGSTGDKYCAFAGTIQDAKHYACECQ